MTELTEATEMQAAAETPATETNPKIERRTAARELRDAMPAAFRLEAGLSICQKIVAMASFGLCDTIFCYSPVGSEVDIRPVIAEAFRRGKRVALPVCDYKTCEMDFYEIKDSELLNENGPMQIPEPSPALARLLTPGAGTLLLVPGLLFDRRGHRIGYGKGMYDRYIRRFPDFLRGSTAVGVTYHALFSDTPIPYTDQDVSMALVVTERGLQFTRRIDKPPKWEVRRRRFVPLVDKDGNPAAPRKREFYNAHYVSPEEGKYKPPRAKELDK